MDVPTVFIILVLGYLISFWAHGFLGVFQAYRAAVSGGAQKELQKALAVFRGLQRNFIICAFIGIFLGIITVLADIENLTRVGQCMAAVLISGLYAALFSLFLVSPFRSRVEALLVEE